MPATQPACDYSSHAVLVGIQLPGVSEADVTSSLDELARLATTLGLVPVARLTQRRVSLGGPTVLGAGKLEQLAEHTGGTGQVPSPLPAHRRKTVESPATTAPAHADDNEEGGDDDDPATTSDGLAVRAGVVLFDHELTPTQLRNLEGASGVEVLDRSAVILAIFQRHARTREARLQVEIARLQYLAPRLRVTGTGHDRQQGGTGARGGAGESSLELDRRRVRDRISEIKRELKVVEREAVTRRVQRGEQSTVALVGYTNAGKSSLMRALTGADVLIENKLFATLDTTVRTLHPDTRPRILVSDTVGFIRRLPHDLVASFRSTLAEARETDLLLHVVDASDAQFRDQIEVTHEVLRGIEAGDRPSLLLLNKVDQLSPEQRAALASELPEAIQLSALDPSDVSALHARIVAWFERDMVDAELFVDYQSQRKLHDIHESARVLAEAHDETGTRVTVRATPPVLARLRAAVGS